jgi:hypothetical protein|tara:strand:+ start:2429 stop:4093 length:1665 start_codon:yes stop_codon:yes gene_type:complete
MEKLSIFLLFYFFIIFSIIGYGNLFSFIFKRNYAIGERGLIGILFLIIISYITNFFTPHSLMHNSLIIIFGLLIFAIYTIKNFKNSTKELLPILVIFFILFIGLLMHKNHDDFYYYHFSYTLTLIEYKKILGLGLLNHGFRTPSSIFYLNSLFYLPYVKFFLVNSGAVFIMGFTNFVLLDKVYTLLKSQKVTFILFLSILSFIYINTAFYRFAEHGTDRSALILIFLLVIIYLESFTSLRKIFSEENFTIYYEKIIILLLLIISLKSFYLIYLSLFVIWLYQFKKFVFTKNGIIVILKNNFTYILIVGLTLVVGHVYLNTGCLVYPASFTCFESISWAIPLDQVEQMKAWYSLWSKAGATPNFRVGDPEFYLSNFNWVSRWIDIYFFSKVSDAIFVIFLISLISIITLMNKKKTSFYNYNNNYTVLFLALVILLLEWFLNHPALRYGGYTLLALMFFIPASFFLEKRSVFNDGIKKRVTILVFITFSVFIVKNISRINNENIKYQYNPLINPFFNITKNLFIFQDILADIQVRYKKTNDNFYIKLNYNLINNTN